jgi:hypothetical protein
MTDPPGLRWRDHLTHPGAGQTRRVGHGVVVGQGRGQTVVGAALVAEDPAPAAREQHGAGGVRNSRTFEGRWIGQSSRAMKAS